MAEVYMYIDGSELHDLLRWMSQQLTADKFDLLMKRTLNEVGKRSKKEIRKAVQQEYEAPAGWINQGIRSAIISGGGGNVLCTIPLVSAKGSVGGLFGASGGKRGWKPGKYRVVAKIVKGGASVLPSAMTHQGGQPPFRNTAFSGVTFTRAGKDRLPIEKVSALALPQMPMNRARPQTERAIIELAEKRAIHNFSRIFG